MSLQMFSKHTLWLKFYLIPFDSLKILDINEPTFYVSKAHNCIIM